MKREYVDIILEEAKKAFKKGEVPVGCIIVKNEKIIAKSHNMVEKKKNALYHAEMIAIKKATKRIGNWRLKDCIMYVTLEPCIMCHHAINLSRIDKVYYLLPNKNAKTKESNFIHLEDYGSDSKKIIQDFFSLKR